MATYPRWKKMTNLAKTSRRQIFIKIKLEKVLLSSAAFSWYNNWLDFILLTYYPNLSQNIQYKY